MSQEPLLLQALRRSPVERPPVWLMRQAGRYLTEYQELKSKHSFLEMCKSSELALEVSLQPIRALDVDAAIVFSDILLPVEALGFEVAFNPGPVIKNPIRSASDIEALKHSPLQQVAQPLYDTIRQLHSAFYQERNPRRAVIGFCGSPWTLACYLIDQGPYKHFLGTPVFARENKPAFLRFLSLLTEVTTEYVLAQAESGADAIQIFDSWGGILSAADYREFSLPFLVTLFEKLKQRGVPSILYVNGSPHLLGEMIASKAVCLSVDWRTDLAAVQQLAPSHALQGNLDPTLLFGDTADVVRHTRTMLESVHPQGYIANLGHGVLPGTSRENVVAFVKTIKDFRCSTSQSPARA